MKSTHEILEETCLEAHRLLCSKQYVEFNHILQDFDFSGMPIIGIALLRASFSVRSFLPDWRSFRERLRDQLGDRAEHLLRGLGEDKKTVI